MWKGGGEMGGGRGCLGGEVRSRREKRRRGRREERGVS